MIFSFDTKKTVIFQFLKMSELPFLRYAGVLTQLFLYLFLAKRKRFTNSAIISSITLSVIDAYSV